MGLAESERALVIRDAEDKCCKAVEDVAEHLRCERTVVARQGCRDAWHASSHWCDDDGGSDDGGGAGDLRGHAYEITV